MFNISKFLFELKSKLPKSNVFVKTKLILFNRVQSILLNVLRRVYLSLVNIAQWRKKWVVDSTFVSKITYTMLCLSGYENIAQEYHIFNVVQI